MPFKSESQRRKFAEMVSQGTMSQATFDEWNKDTPAELPEKIEPKENKGSPTVKTVRRTKVIR